MNYELILNYAYILMAVMAALVFATNIIVEVFKYIFPKLPTSILAVVVAILVTALAEAMAITYYAIPFAWYFVPAALIMGIFVAYAAMFGFDKFKEAFEKLKAHKK